MKMNTLIKILIGVSLIFSITSFFLMAFHVIDVSASDISTVALAIMSPEVFVGISKIVENSKSTNKEDGTTKNVSNDSSDNNSNSNNSSDKL